METIPEHFPLPDLTLTNLDQMRIYFAFELARFLLNVISYSYILAKFYKVCCYSKITFEWLPMINPYMWPFSVFHILTDPYFAFWNRILPDIKFNKSSTHISGLIALEAINSLIYVFVRVTTPLIEYLDRMELEITVDKLDRML